MEKKSTGREKEEEILVILTEEDRAKDTTVSRWLSIFFPGLGNLSIKNRLRDRFSGSKSRQVTGQGFSEPNFRQESRKDF